MRRTRTANLHSGGFAVCVTHADCNSTLLRCTDRFAVQTDDVELTQHASVRNGKIEHKTKDISTGKYVFKSLFL